MINTVFTLIVVLGLAFGGGTAAAQTSMPDNMLYPLKIWSEEARISFATDPDTQFQLHMQFAERRMEEIQSMLQNGIQPPDVVMWQFQNQLTHAFSIAAAMADEQLQASLSQLQIRLQEQQRNLTRLQLNSDEAQNLLQTREKIRSMIQEQVQLCQSGLNAPDQFREQLQINEQYHLQQQLHDEIEEPEGNLNQNQHQNQDGVLNMDQNQNQYRDNGNSSPENSIVPPESGEMNGTGPNDGTCPNSSSGDCDCDGTGNLNACDKGGNP